MGEPRRWKGYGEQNGALAGRTTWTGPTLAAGERVCVREDRATEVDIEAVAKRLFLRRFPGLEWVPGGGGHVAEQAECRRKARDLLPVIFGEKASRV